MNLRLILHWAVGLIAAATILTGLLQMLAPNLVLTLLAVENSPTVDHLFSIVGMFMVLFGGATIHALTEPIDHRAIFLWAGLQKLGAAVAVGMGVANDIFSPLGLLVAGFDLVSGILYLVYRHQTRMIIGFTPA